MYFQKVKFYFTILLILGACMSVSSQELYTRRYTLQDGLKALETYDVAIDSHNKIWVRSGYGFLGCYDGIAFTWYDLGEMGFEGHTGGGMTFLDTILFLNDSKKQVYYFFQDSLIPFSKIKYGSYFFKKNNTICFFNERLDSIHCFDPHSRRLSSSPQAFYRFFNKYPGTKGFHLSNRYPIKKNPLLIYHEVSGNSVVMERNSSESKFYPYIISYHDEYTYFGLKETIQLLEPTEGNSLELKVVDFLPEKYGVTYGSLIPNIEFHLYANEEKENTYELFKIDNKSFVSVGEFRSGNILSYKLDSLGFSWVTGHEGLLRINPYITWFSNEQDGMVRSLHSISEDKEGRIWFGGYKSGIAVYSNDKLTFIPSSTKKEFINLLPGSRTVDGHLYFLVGGYPIFTIQNNQFIQKPIQFTNLEEAYKSAYILEKLSTGEIVLGMQKHGIAFVKDFKENANTVHTGKQNPLIAGDSREYFT